MLKILVLASPNPRGRGGERRSFNILARARSHDIEPTILISMNRNGLYRCPKPLCEMYDVYIIGKRRLSIKLPSGLKSIKRYANLITDLSESMSLLRQNFDITVSHHENQSFIMKASIMGKMMRQPWTAVLQSFIYIDPLIRDRNLAWHRLIWKYFWGFPYSKLALDMLNTTKVLCISPSIPYEMQRRGFPLKNTLILNPPLGIDHEEIARTLPSNEEFDAIYMSSSISVEKGALDLLKVWKLVVNEKPKARLCVLGAFSRTEHLNLYNELLHRFGIQNNVSYRGFVDGVAKYSLIKSSKVFIYPSVIDAFPTVVLESLACGIPVVGYNVPFMWNFRTRAVELTHIGDTEGLARKTIELINSPSKSLSKEARSYALNYSWDRAVEAEKKAYLDIINS
jgi:glycosyltransferase involved in cell wall biosynthesis